MRKNTGGVKFWQIAVDEANGGEYFGQMTRCIYEHWPGKFWQIVHHSPNSQKFSPSNIFPCTLINANYICFAAILIVS